MRNFFVIFFLVIGVLSIGLKDQYNTSDDDPNQDHAPSKYWETVADNPVEPMAIVTDDAGYDNFDLGVDFAEPHITTNPRNPTQFFTAFNTNGTHLTMNGIDWFANNPNFGASMAGDPVTAYDSLGRLYYENMYQIGANIVGTRIITSTNNGQNWLTPTNGNVGNDKNWIAADQTGGPFKNNVYSVMTPGNVARSTDGGASFNVVAGMTNQSPGMMPAVGPNMIGGNVPGGCVYVVTVTGPATGHTYNFYRSTDGGTSFAHMSSQNFANAVGDFVGGRNSVQNMRTRPYPFIHADNSNGPNRGRLHLIYSSNTPAGPGNKPDIFARYSDDQAATWSAPVKINDDANSESHNQWHPSAWCDKETGRLYVKWYDTRDCPTSDSALVYASFSTNGGASFVPNVRISGKKFRINCTSCGGGGTPAYLGDYDAMTSNSLTSMMVWTDFRAGNFGSYVAYFPDYAMKVDKSIANVSNGGSTTVTVSVPSVKYYSSSVKFTASLETNPSSGSITFSFQNGKDSITSFPDSVKINVNAVGSVTPGSYNLRIEGRGPNGTPAHRRTLRLLVNTSLIKVATNRGGAVSYKVNGVSYNAPQEFVLNNGSNVTIEAPPSVESGSNKYIFNNWSNGGTATQTFPVNGNIDLMATYKIQYKVVVISNPPSPNIFGNTFQDSASSFKFGVNYNRIIINQDSTYWFRGWNGSGPGAYTSPDSLGLDDTVTLSITNPIVEIVRWSLNNPSPVGVSNISSEIPDKFALHQNYPNPFNPSTNIQFDIPKAGLVKIVVYDMLGKQVETLVNQVQQPGKFQVNFNAAHLASGIYYYRIEAADFVQVKKMLLIK